VKWLGVADRVGQVLCYYILNERTRDIIRSTLQQFETNKVKVWIKNLDISIQERIDNVDLADIPIELQDEYEILETLEPVAHKPDNDDIGDEAYDSLLSVEVMLPLDGLLQPARVTGR
jgi:hypothetical protein